MKGSWKDEIHAGQEVTQSRRQHAADTWAAESPAHWYTALPPSVFSLSWLRPCAEWFVSWALFPVPTLSRRLLSPNAPIITPFIKKTRSNKCWWESGEKGILCTVGGNVNWYSHYGEQYRGSLKKERKEGRKRGRKEGRNGKKEKRTTI